MNKKDRIFIQFRSEILLLLSLLFIAGSAAAQTIPKPADVFGFRPGTDYKLAKYDQMLEYYDQLDAASKRVKKVKIGETVLGRPMILLYISSEENMQQLERWREISEKMARARINEEEAKKLSKEGRAVVWIDGGMHSNELAHGQMTPELAYKIATEETEEMQAIRENVITLLMPMMNPDGVDIISSWYLEHIDTPYETTNPPWLYHHYVGHDNNRDWFMNNMPETRAVTQKIYREWFPQIVYNHHQPAPEWTRISLPPYADPVNPRIHPGVTTGVSEIGSAMMQRFSLNDMPGAIADNYYTMFWNGGGRTVPYYHNIIGILTEVAHRSPTPRFYEPDSLPKTVGTGTPTDGTDILYPDPWKGGESHFRDAIDYMLTASMAALDLASKRHEQYLYNIYSMGRDAIEKGDSGDPFAYVIPAKQWDDWEAKNLVNVLLQGGLEVQQATGSFSAGGERYDEGSYILYAGQSFRPYLTDLLEKQEYPTRLLYPGGPPDTPYDLAGWTLPIQMGVTVDRIDDSFDATTDEITELVTLEESTIDGDAGYGFMISAKSNASVKAVNILLEGGAEVSRIVEASGEMPAGSFIVTGADASAIKELGLSLQGLPEEPDVETVSLKQRPKVGIYKSWIANMDEGWTRWLMEEYNFEVDTLHNADIQEGDLSEYSSIIIPAQSPDGILNGYSVQEMPEQYTGGLGLKGSLALQEYTEAGGTLIAFDKASNFVIHQFGLPLRNAVSGLSENEFFIPGSLIRSVIDSEDPLAWGMQDTVSASFSDSFAFEIEKQSKEGEGGTEDIADAPKAPVDVVASYADSSLLMSGWAMGEDKYIAGKPAMVRVPKGNGQIVLFAFRPQFRGQPRGTYKLIFNAIMNSTMEEFPEAD